MQIEFIENKYGVDIILKPDTVEETARLLRFSRNAKAEKPSIYLSFSNNPVCYIHMAKVNETVQINSIKPGNK